MKLQHFIRAKKIPCRGHVQQGCQMIYFQTKNPNLGKFSRASSCTMLINFTVIWNTLRPFGIFYGLYIFSRFGMLYRGKSGNPDI
jgi:hypothetical protein